MITTIGEVTHQQSLGTTVLVLVTVLVGCVSAGVRWALATALCAWTIQAGVTITSTQAVTLPAAGWPELLLLTTAGLFTCRMDRGYRTQR